MYSNTKKTRAVVAKIGLFSSIKPKEINDVKYADNLHFNDFKNLIKMNLPERVNELYVSFDENFIKDFNQMDAKEMNAFREVVARGQLCAAHGKSGIKNLAGSSIKCIFKKGEQLYLTQFTHELKINSDNRIALFTLSPVNPGPTILVASHYIKHGFHTKDKLAKIYQTLDFDRAANAGLVSALQA